MHYEQELSLRLTNDVSDRMGLGGELAPDTSPEELAVLRTAAKAEEKKKRAGVETVQTSIGTFEIHKMAP